MASRRLPCNTAVHRPLARLFASCVLFASPRLRSLKCGRAHSEENDRTSWFVGHRGCRETVCRREHFPLYETRRTVLGAWRWLCTLALRPDAAPRPSARVARGRMVCAVVVHLAVWTCGRVAAADPERTGGCAVVVLLVVWTCGRRSPKNGPGCVPRRISPSTPSSRRLSSACPTGASTTPSRSPSPSGRSRCAPYGCMSLIQHPPTAPWLRHTRTVCVWHSPLPALLNACHATESCGWRWHAVGPGAYE